MDLALVGLLGLVFGSFANSLIWRLSDEQAPRTILGRSVCVWCRRPISTWDNIPLVSFIVLRGRCRNCNKKIPWQYPVVEGLMAVVFILVWVLTSGSPLLYRVSLEIIAFCLVGIFFADLIYGIIPDEFVIIGTAVGAVKTIIGGRDLAEGILVASLSAAAFFLVTWVTRFKGMGLGDAKLAFLVGIVLGWPGTVIGIWAAFMIGGAVATGLLALKRTALSATIVLGPFLIIGLVVAALWQERILQVVGI